MYSPFHSLVRSIPAVLMAIGISTRFAAAAVPTLDELAAEWMPVSDVLSNAAISNFRGSLKTQTNLLGVTLAAFAPYSQGNDTATLSLNGSDLTAQQSRWFPYQVVRQADSAGIHVETQVRMPFEREGVLFSIKVSNTTSGPLTPSVAVALRGYVRNIGGTWTWDTPRPNTAGFSAALANSGTALVISDTQSAAATAFAFATPPTSLALSSPTGTATWNLTLAAGQSQTLQFVMAVSNNSTAAVNAATNWAASFSDVFGEAQSAWEARWQSAFQPGNTNYSGSMPVLNTTNAALRRVYYSGALVPLLMQRNGLPHSPRAYVTCGPQWAVTLEYFWDTAMWGDLWAQLDPVIMKAHCKDYLALNIHSCYAKDYLSGGAAGPWYAPNDISVFGVWWSYLTATGDWDVLNDTVAGQTVLQHLHGIAVHWKSLVPAGATLADYGDNHNILECHANYIKQVASLNAANVWMMRRMGDIYQRLGQTANAASLRADADAQVPNVLALYNGDGTWNSNHNGPIVNVRHIYDYIMLGRTLSENLSGTVRSSMTSFVENELLVPGWLRAMSLNDPLSAAANSQRPDHGPTGSYDGWPALTAGVMARFGEYDKALSLLDRCQGVLAEGPFSQSHQLVSGTARLGARVPESASLKPAAAITVEAWINASAWRTEFWRGSIISKDDWASNDGGYVLRCGANGRVSFAVVAEGSWSDAVTTATLPANTWHHVAGTYDGSQIRVYVNGVQQASLACSGAITHSPYPLAIGNGTYAKDRAFTGSIDGVRVYGRALSATEIATHAAANGNYAPADTNSLVLALAFNENSGITAANTAAGGSNAVLYDPSNWAAGIEGSALAVPATEPNNFYVRIASPDYLQDYNEGTGASYANTILTDFFGFSPTTDNFLNLSAPAAPRGFTGTLSGVKFRGISYTLSSDASGVTALVPVPELHSFGPKSGNTFPLRFGGTSGNTYKILGTSDLTLPAASWTILSSGTFSGEPVTFTDTNATSPWKFYRIASP